VGKTTGIAWTRSSWNPWIGCTKVSPGCDACYAEAPDARYRWQGTTHWGPGVPRMRTSVSNWKQPLAWNKKAAVNGERWTVFPSLCDPFDNEVPDAWRLDLFSLIAHTPHLTWLLLTKRIGNVPKMLSGDSLAFEAMQRNVWLGASVVNQEEADRDIPKLLAVPAANRFVSYEPALGPIEFHPDWLTCPGGTEYGHGFNRTTVHAGCCEKHARLHWVIAGGESGPHARPAHPDWFRSARDQCAAAGVPFFFKQWGEWAPPIAEDGVPPGAVEGRLYRVGKKAAGRLLDGREHSEYPA